MPTVNTILKLIEGISGAYGTGAFNNTPVALAREMMNRIDVDWSDPNIKIFDPCCGFGTFLICSYEKLREHGHSPKHIVENMLYGNDNDRLKARYAARALSKLAKNDVTIYNVDALSGGFNDMQFDVVLGNPPYNNSTGGGQGTGGDTYLYRKFYNKSLDLLKEDGYLAFITLKGISSDIKKSKRKVIHFDLMTDSNHWKFNTAWFVVKNEVSEEPIIIKNKIFDKIYCVDGNPMWNENNGGVEQKYIQDNGTEAIIEMGKKNSPMKMGYVSDEAVNSKRFFKAGPKYATVLLGNSKYSTVVTDKAIYAPFAALIYTKDLAEAEKLKLFVDNNKALKWAHKKLKTKGLFWTMRYLKPFDLSQIETGYEYPKEWDLSEEEIRIIEHA